MYHHCDLAVHGDTIVYVSIQIWIHRLLRLFFSFTVCLTLTLDLVKSIETELCETVILYESQIWCITLTSVCTLKMEATCSSETLVLICQTTL